MGRSVGGKTAPGQRSLMYHQMAEYYDSLLGERDYSDEVRRLEILARRFGRSRGRAWLDVACGTGRHLELLRRRWRVVGVDESPEMLRLARRRLRGVRLVRGEFRSFRLGRTFDVLSCLYGAVGHLPSERALSATFANFARHLAPGGVLLVEPWPEPAEFRPGSVRVVSGTVGATSVVRVGFSYPRGRFSAVDHHYLIGERGPGIRHLQETVLGLLVPYRRLAELLTGAGLKPRLLLHGLGPGRRLLVGCRPP